MSEATQTTEKPRFAIFRASDARPYSEEGPMYMGERVEVAPDSMAKLQEAGYDSGHEVKLVYSSPGFSLTYVWFKSGFPLPRHSHNADCVYYIMAGSLKIGTEVLGKGDGFFLGVDAPYSYTPGAEGVELLEIRNKDRFDINVLASNPAFWSKAIEEVGKRSPGWASEPPPSVARREKADA